MVDFARIPSHISGCNKVLDMHKPNRALLIGGMTMKCPKYRILAVALLLVIVAPGPTFAQGDKISILIQECQAMYLQNEEMVMVWWLPAEFWKASFANTPEATAQQLDDVLSVLEPYTLMMVLEGTQGLYGATYYASEDSVRTITRLSDSAGNVYEPYGEFEISDEARNLLMMMKPLIANMAGAVGENMHWIVFPASGKDRAPIANPTAKGHFKVLVGDREFIWRLPLDAALPAKECTKCQLDCKGSWEFCPWCGGKIANAETESP
jgi:hypothetical protein